MYRYMIEAHGSIAPLAMKLPSVPLHSASARRTCPSALEIQMIAFMALVAIVAVVTALALAHDLASDSLLVTNPGMMSVAAAR
jgi:hypothetical protein